MSDEQLLQELNKLRQDIRLHSYRYHVLDSPIISDLEYDRLMENLLRMENEHPDWITPDSPTRRTGARPSDRFSKVRHPAPILSLASVTAVAEVQSWYDRISKLDDRVAKSGFVLEPKIDGLTVVLHYHDGIFIQGATRGDGEVGEDITANLRTIKAVPLRIPVEPNGPVPPSYLAVRGEAFIFIKDFLTLNQKLEEAGEKTYLNPRNTAAGSLRQLDPSLTAARPLTLLTYQIVAANGPTPSSQWEILQYLRALGFPVTNLAGFCPDQAAMLKSCEQWLQKRDTLDFEADGAVIKLNDLVTAAELGFVGKDPRGALALKFPAREVSTILNEIRVNVGRTGVITPYAVLDPVEIGGVIIRQATLHNFDFIAEKDIRQGDRVMVKRAGDVIPYVIGPVIDARQGTEPIFSPPAACPACGQKVDHAEGEVAWYCDNSACPAQLVRNLEHYVSRSALDIVGLGIKIVEQLVEARLIHDSAELFTLKRSDLLKLEGFAEKKADNLLEAIARAKQQPFNRWINAIGIRGVGEVMAADLARQFHDLDELGRAGDQELQQIEGIGPNIARAIVDWFSQPANQLLLKKFRAAGVWPKRQEVHEITGGALQGKTFVVTGTLPGYSREEINELIHSQGGKVTDSVSKNTSFLVAGEAAGSKLEKARLLGIPILDEAGLLNLIGNPIPPREMDAEKSLKAQGRLF